MSSPDIKETLERLLKRYDAVEVKKINGKLQLIGVTRKMEERDA